jgi:GcrA cell cycle regulator
VLGKIHRLNLAQPAFKLRHLRPKKVPLKRQRRPRPPRPRAVRAPSALMAAFRELGLGPDLSMFDPAGLHQHASKAFGPACGLLELDRSTCRWPVGEPDHPGFAFCGAAPFKRYPYCLGHCLIAYRPEAADEQARAARAPAPLAMQPSRDQSRARAA